MGIEEIDDAREVGERPCKSIYLVDDDRIDPACPAVIKQTLQRGSLQRSTGVR